MPQTVFLACGVDAFSPDLSPCSTMVAVASKPTPINVLAPFLPLVVVTVAPSPLCGKLRNVVHSVVGCHTCDRHHDAAEFSTSIIIS